MSLFTLCHWWNVRCPDTVNNYDSNHLHCCRLGLEANESDIVVVGSFNGYLSVYKPTSEINEDGIYVGYQPTDVIIEKQLEFPIISISSGQIMQKGDNKAQLIILHPFKLVVYVIQITDGSADHGDMTTLLQIAHWDFNVCSYSLIVGQFGRIKGRDLMCISHLDSTLTFIDSDSGIVVCTLYGPQRNIPSKFIYVPRIDSLVTVSSAWHLECYSYRDITECSALKRPVESAWTFCIGEFAIDYAVQQISENESAIVIMGENHLIVISDNATPIFFKRLDYTSVCMYTFVVGWYWEPNIKLIIAVVSDRGSLMIYDNEKLLWIANTSQEVVAIRRANIRGLPGALVLLDATGFLSINYLGSEPHIFKVPQLEWGELHIEKAHKELMELEKEIRQSVDLTDMSLDRVTLERDVNVMLNIKACENNGTLPDELKNLNKPVCCLDVKLHVRKYLDQIQVCFSAANGIRFTSPIKFLAEVQPNSETQFDSWLYVDPKVDIATANITVLVSFINHQGILRISEGNINIPLNVLMKKSTNNVTVKPIIHLLLAANGGISMPSLAQIFGNEFSFDSDETGCSLESIYTQKSVQLTHSDGQIELIAEEINCVPLVLEHIMKTVKCFLVCDRNDQLSKGSIIPMPIIDSAIDKHMRVRQDLMETKKKFQNYMYMMQLIQRRFIQKVDDRSADALKSITHLKNDMHTKLTDTLREMSEKKEQLKLAQCQFSAVMVYLELVVKLINIPPAMKECLKGLLIQPVKDFMDQSWNEIMLPAIEINYQFGPFRKNKNQFNDSDFKNISFEIGRYKKHFLYLLETVNQMARSNDTNQYNLENNETSSKPLDDDYAVSSDWINE